MGDVIVLTYLMDAKQGETLSLHNVVEKWQSQRQEVSETIDEAEITDWMILIGLNACAPHSVTKEEINDVAAKLNPCGIVNVDTRKFVDDVEGSGISELKHLLAKLAFKKSSGESRPDHPEHVRQNA